MNRREFGLGMMAAAGAASGARPASAQKTASRSPGVKKIGDVVLYRDERYYAAFPSIVTCASGEVLVAFRRAPERRRFGENRITHTDPNAYLVLIRSADGAETWSPEPELIYAHPLAGSQDPCMVQLRDGALVLTSYAWARLEPEAAARLKNTPRHGPFCFLGGYLLRSPDEGRSWQGPFIPPPLPESPARDAFDEPLASYNRGAMIERADGRLYWIVAGQVPASAPRTSNHLLVSSDRGETWEYRCSVAVDKNVTFNEASMIETPNGDLVAFLRTADFDDHTVIVRSRDGGRSFEPWRDAGFQGHPHHALALPDGRVLLVYGYRHRPYGIRARVLNAECTDYASAEEIVLRDDGGGGDLGYPWAANLPDGRVLVVYYFNLADGTRHIAGTLLEVA